MSVSPVAPTVGRIVQVHDPARTAPLAAIISEVVGSDGCTLHVFDPRGGTKTLWKVPYGQDASRGISWSWPPKV